MAGGLGGNSSGSVLAETQDWKLAVDLMLTRFMLQERAFSVRRSVKMHKSHPTKDGIVEASDLCDSSGRVSWTRSLKRRKRHHFRHAPYSWPASLPNAKNTKKTRAETGGIHHSA